MVGQVVSLGIGSPAGIPTFLLVGLSVNAVSTLPHVIQIDGTYLPTVALAATYLQTVSLTGTYLPTVALDGAVED